MAKNKPESSVWEEFVHQVSHHCTHLLSFCLEYLPLWFHAHNDLLTIFFWRNVTYSDEAQRFWNAQNRFHGLLIRIERKQSWELCKPSSKKPQCLPDITILRYTNTCAKYMVCCGVSEAPLSLLPTLGALFLLFGCLVQPQYEGICPALLSPVSLFLRHLLFPDGKWRGHGSRGDRRWRGTGQSRGRGNWSGCII